MSKKIKQILPILKSMNNRETAYNSKAYIFKRKINNHSYKVILRETTVNIYGEINNTTSISQKLFIALFPSLPEANMRGSVQLPPTYIPYP